MFPKTIMNKKKAKQRKDKNIQVNQFCGPMTTQTAFPSL